MVTSLPKASKRSGPEIVHRMPMKLTSMSEDVMRPPAKSTARSTDTRTSSAMRCSGFEARSPAMSSWYWRPWLSHWPTRWFVSHSRQASWISCLV